MHSKRRKPLFYFAQGCAYAAGAWTHTTAGMQEVERCRKPKPRSGVKQGGNVHRPCRSTRSMYYPRS
jgi:hypothetical protein